MGVARLARPAAAVLVLGLATAGCELVAGIEDLALTGDAGNGRLGDATIARDASGAGADSSGGNEGAAVDALVEAPLDAPGTLDDAEAATTETDAAPSETGGDAPADAGRAPRDATAKDARATDAADAEADADAAEAEAGLLTELIDDMEVHNELIPKLGGRDGEWFLFNDKTDGGLETFGDFAIVPPRGTSMYAARMYGSAFTGWGEGMGFNINSPTSGPMVGQRLTYDASPYRGFYFYGRSLSGSSIQVGITVPDHNTDPQGGVCTTCGDHFSKTFTFTSQWTAFTVYFTDLKQGGYGMPQQPALDVSQIYGVSFIAVAAPTFDVWVDDIYFILP